MLPEAERLAAWEDLLSGFEAELADGEAVPAPRTPWKRPRGLGALPPELAPRVRTIVLAQAAQLERMKREHAVIARHLAAVQSIPTRLGSRTPVYLDAQA